MAKPEFTPEQIQAIGELVCDMWDCHFQTSGSRAGVPVLYAQAGPRQRVRRFEIQADGTVVEERG